MLRRRLATLLIAAGATLASAGVAHADFSLNSPLLVALNAQAGGATANFTFTGAGSNVTVAMRYDRANPAVDPGVGFVVYQDANVLANEPASNGSRGAVAYTFFASPGAHYGVQPYNYASAFNTTGHLLVSDLSQVPPISPSAGADRGPLLRDQSVTQQLVGVAGGGAFHNYSFAGDGQPVTFVLNSPRRDPVTDGSMGLAVWDQWGNSQPNLNAQQAGAPGGAIIWTLIPRAGAAYGVQVFNYQPNVTMTYVLAAL